MFTLEDFAAEHGTDFITIGLVSEGRLELAASDHAPTPGPGDVLLALIPEAAAA